MVFVLIEQQGQEPTASESRHYWGISSPALREIVAAKRSTEVRDSSGR
jgi:hypothetical protein